MTPESLPRIVVIQARLESQRRSGKGLAMIGPKTLISTVLERSLAIDTVERVVLATTNREADDRLADHVLTQFGDSIDVFRGSSEDVQSRFIHVAEQFGKSILGRVTADDPFKDPQLYRMAFDLLVSSGVDYVSIGKGPIPLGMDVEVFTSEALIRSRALYPNSENLEHVTIEISRRSEFAREQLLVPTLRGTARLTVDYEEDIAFASEVAHRIEMLGGGFDHLTTLEAVGLVPPAKRGAY